MSEIIYYRFKKNYPWLAFNVLFLIALISCACYCKALWYWLEMQVLLGVFSVYLLIWCYIHLCKHKMAVITDEYIKIDHTNPLKWTDIASYEERTVQCCGKKRILALIPKEGIDYKYNYLQKHNGDFTPFSIPLYGILTPEDEEKVIKIVKDKVKL